ncbi:hypothetical protein XENORESO_020883 [Xenotaenia resolanae]|uniref:Uncharacterized protein n=1 Tax=Xenotaenia resolanae TaxID=208358 RepID=A0ABV0WBR6_9TELE
MRHYIKTFGLIKVKELSPLAFHLLRSRIFAEKRRASSSKVINAYLTLLVKKFNDKNTERAFVIDSFEMTNIWQQKKPKIRIS